MKTTKINYAVSGMRTLLPLFVEATGNTNDELADNAIENLRSDRHFAWTHKDATVTFFFGNNFTLTRPVTVAP